MNVRIDPSIFALYPELVVAVLVVHDMNNGGIHPEIDELATQEIEFARAVFQTTPVGSHPVVRAWRNAYAVFGPASRYHSSVEALMTRIAKGGVLPHINPVVDLYNIVSLKYCVPVGGEDLHTLRGDLVLRRASGQEEFFPLGSDQNDPPEAGEVAYFDEAGCVCRRFNWREADRTKLTANTRHAIFSIEGIPPTNDIDVKEAADTLSQWITRFCGGKAGHYLVNAQIPQITIPL